MSTSPSLSRAGLSGARNAGNNFKFSRNNAWTPTFSTTRMSLTLIVSRQCNNPNRQSALTNSGKFTLNQPSRKCCTCESGRVGHNLPAASLFHKRWLEPTVIVTCVRWYLRNSLSLREVRALIAERGLPSITHPSGDGRKPMAQRFIAVCRAR